jgi:hypothetical protein
VVIHNTIGQNLARSKLKVIYAGLMQFVCFGDGRPDVNAKGYYVTDTNNPKKKLASLLHLIKHSR